MARRFVIGDIHGAYLALIQVLERCGFDYDNDELITIGDIVDGWEDSYRCVEELLKIKNRIDIRGNHDCLDEKTEVFTKRGWLKYNEIIESDFVLGINDITGFSEWQKINNIIIKTSNHLNYYSNNRIDFAMTDGHRIIHKLKSGNYEYKILRDLKFNDRLRIPLGCKNGIIENLNYSDDEIRLIAWILTDGNISKKHGYVTIYQSKIENLNHIENILKRNSLKYTHYKRVRNLKTILGKKIKSIKECNEFKILAESSKIINDKLLNKSRNIPKWCYELSQRQLEIFLTEIIRGDGSNYKTKNHILYGTKKFLEEIQPLFNISGYSCNLKKSNRLDYRLNISKNNISTIRQDLNKINRIKGEFNVWCLSVPFSNFLVRRNDKTYFTGNCWFNEFLETTVHAERWGMGALSTAKSYAKGAGIELLIQKLPSKDDRFFRDNGYILNFNSGDVPDTHKNFFRKQNNYYKDHLNNLFVHGGFNLTIPIKETLPYILMWDRHLWRRALEVKDSGMTLIYAEQFNQIFIGHTAVRGGTEPVKADKIWNVDTGAGGGGKLTIMDVDTNEYWQSDNVPDLYPDDEHNKDNW